MNHLSGVIVRDNRGNRLIINDSTGSLAEYKKHINKMINALNEVNPGQYSYVAGTFTGTKAEWHRLVQILNECDSLPGYACGQKTNGE